MKNVILSITIQTPRSLASPEWVASFCNVLRSVNPCFVPAKFGSFEPLKTAFDLAAAEAQLAECHEANGTLMFFDFAKPLQGSMSFHTSRGPRVQSNGLKVSLNYTTIESRLEDVIRFMTWMYEALNSAYACATLSGGNPNFVYVDDPKKNWGEINGCKVPPWNPSGLQKLPGICWINLFGPEYVQFIGRDVLASLPAYRARWSEDGRSFWLQATERPEEMLTEEGIELADEIKRRIGKPKAFYGHDPSVPSYRAVYESPDFDFSELRPKF